MIAVRDDTAPFTLRLLDVADSEVTVPLAGASVRSLTAHGDRFLLLLTEPDTTDRPPDRDGRPWLAWLSLTGQLTHGDRLPNIPYLDRPVPGSDPALLADEYSLHAVADDLTLAPWGTPVADCRRPGPGLGASWGARTCPMRRARAGPRWTVLR